MAPPVGIAFGLSKSGRSADTGVCFRTHDPKVSAFAEICKNRNLVLHMLKSAKGLFVNVFARLAYAHWRKKVLSKLSHGGFVPFKYLSRSTRLPQQLYKTSNEVDPHAINRARYNVHNLWQERLRSVAERPLPVPALRSRRDRALQGLPRAQEQVRVRLRIHRTMRDQ